MYIQVQLLLCNLKCIHHAHIVSLPGYSSITHFYKPKANFSKHRHAVRRPQTHHCILFAYPTDPILFLSNVYPYLRMDLFFPPCMFMNDPHVSSNNQSEWGMYFFSRMCSVRFPQPSRCVAAASEVLSLPPPTPLCIASQQTESER